MATWWRANAAAISAAAVTVPSHRTHRLTDSFWGPAVYDVTRRETFDSLGEIWMQEVDMYSTIENAIKMVVANKVDRVWSCLCACCAVQ
jgi:hypothetical protein